MMAVFAHPIGEVNVGGVSGGENDKTRNCLEEMDDNILIGNVCLFWCLYHIHILL